MNTKKQAFTLAEVLITLGVIGVVAAMTLPALIQKQNDKATVAKVKKMYSIINNAFNYWMIENGCDKDVSICLAQYNAYDCKNAFSGIEKQLNIVAKRYQNEPITNISWLPDVSYGLDGSRVIRAWNGVNRISSESQCVCNYKFYDGTTMTVGMPDTHKKSVLIFFDINGKKKPNQVGKDIFPMGVGSYNSKSKTVNPYYVEDNTVDNYGLCHYRDGNECSADDGKSPTAYILKHDKVFKF